MYFVKGMKYEYNGENNVEAWTKFVTEGYKNSKGEKFDMGFDWGQFLDRESSMLFDELLAIPNESTLVFMTIVGGLLLIFTVSYWSGTIIESKLEEDKKKISGEKKKNF